MNKTIDEHAQMDVVISNLRATDEELEKLINCIVRGLGNKATHPVAKLDGMDTKGSRYVVTFKVLELRNLSPVDIVRKWLDKLELGGFEINGTLVPRQ